MASTSLFSARGPYDTFIVSSGRGAREAINDARTVRVVKRLAQATPRVAAICTGAFPLAATGLLDGRRITTHWTRHQLVAQTFPAVTVDPDAIFVVDGKFHTSAGGTAGIDLALAMVEHDLGRAVALSVARQLVVFLKRPGGQSQFSGHLMAEIDSPGSERFSALARWMIDHLADDLSVDALACRAAMSPRNFARRFRGAMGVTPAQYVQRLRIDAARRLLTEGDLPMGDVAERCGFGTLETLRLAFQRHLRVTPQEFRARFRRPDPIVPPAELALANG
jgi:transcriptional regulator GlxA family with amidase domain